MIAFVITWIDIDGTKYEKIVYAENIDIKDNSTEFIKIWKEVMQCAKLIASGQAVIRQIGNQKYTCRRVKK